MWLGPSLCESVKYFYTLKSKNTTNDVITYFKLVIIKTIKLKFLTLLLTKMSLESLPEFQQLQTHPPLLYINTHLPGHILSV